MNRIHTYTREEILATNIRLDKEWDIFLTPFIEYNRLVHKEECEHLKAEFSNSVDCTCEPEVIPGIMAKILGWGERYYQCTITEDKAEIPDGVWKLPYSAILEVPILAEDIQNALHTTAEMLKAYEVSGNTDYDFFKLKMPDGQVLEGKELSRVIYS